MILKLVDVFNFILEGAYDAQGVGDKAYEKFHIPTDIPNLKTLAELQRQENGKPVARVGDENTYIFLNPKSLRYFGKNTRAVADNHGNIYVAQKDGNFIHYDIAKAVSIASPDQSDRRDDFLCLIRLGNTNAFRDISDYWDNHDQAKAIRLLRGKHQNFHIMSNIG